MGKLRVIYRFFVFFWMFQRNLWEIKKKDFHWKNNDKQLEFLMENRRMLFGRLLSMLGLKLNCTTAVIPEGQNIYVSNHRTWTDVIVIMSEFSCFMIAKVEAKKNFIFGEYVDRTGALFVERENNNDRLKVLRQMESVLKEGHSILIFPEGTTHFDSKTRPFNEGIFLLAAKHQIPIVPVTIDYDRKALEFVGKQTLFANFFKNFHKRIINVFLNFSTPVLDNDRKRLLATTQSEIDCKIQEFKKQYDLSN